MTLQPVLAPGLRAVIAGTVGRRHRPEQYYAGAGNHFWMLLHGSGLVPAVLAPDDAGTLPRFGIGLTDLVLERVQRAGREPETLIHIDDFVASISRVRPSVLAFVSKTAAIWCARGLGERLPHDYGPLPWAVGGVPTFVLPGPSGANNGMPLAVRLGLWRDLADFLDLLE